MMRLALQVFSRLSRGIAAVEHKVKEAGYEFAYNEHLGYIHRSSAASGAGVGPE
jgi:hypothetical protein